ncbi:MAG: hypothetical protein HY727_15190 [Candidatus Rokubacteria bacterium]|nr:hypothetical protein [Candidatus Rokubacteria bacterium]
MPEPIRDQILEKIVAKLQSMTGTRQWGTIGPWTYANNPVVKREFTTLEQAKEYPWLCVIEGPGSTFEEIATGAAPYATFDHKFAVTVYGYVKGDDVTSRSRWLQRLWEDTVRTLLKNAKLDGIVRDLAIDAGVETDEGENEPLGAFAQGVTVLMDDHQVEVE